MANTTIDLYNLAISRLGGNRINPVVDGVENTTESEECAIKLPNIVRSCLRKTPWAFATKTKYLSYLGEGNSLWGYRYQYPAECLFLQSVGIQSADKIPFQVEIGDDGTRNILCNIEKAEGIYTLEILKPEQWDPLFYDAIAWELASELALTLSGSGSKAETLAAKANMAWGKAQEIDARESQAFKSVSTYVSIRS